MFFNPPCAARAALTLEWVDTRLASTRKEDLLMEKDALARVLAERAIRGAGLDTFGVEPLPADHPFRGLDNLVTTPHLGYVTEGCYRIFFHDIVEDIAAWLDGNPIRVVGA